MTLVVPNVGEVKSLELYLKRILTLKLFANNLVPDELITAGSLTEVSGGGYAAKTLAAESWTITSGAPSFGSYAAQDFSFTGATGGTGQVYGYYVIDAEGILCWVERFSESVLPYVPAAGSVVRIIPRFEAS